VVEAVGEPQKAHQHWAIATRLHRATNAKVVLIERGQPFDDKALPKLARAAQVSLGLDPSTGSGPDGSDGVRRILGAVTTIANGLAERRNRGLGSHGPATARVGLGTRHAHLAVNAALTWCQLMLDTLADPAAPWRIGTPNSRWTSC
jgi:hypothetical protein